MAGTHAAHLLQYQPIASKDPHLSPLLEIAEGVGGQQRVYLHAMFRLRLRLLVVSLGWGASPPVLYRNSKVPR
jgi:hypothetical protein